jgi:glucan biosynthesis protein C
MAVTDPGQISVPAEGSAGKTTRLHYLDWLRVILIFGVFLFHAAHPFDAVLDWHIKNTERSDAITGFLLLINPWGMPLFFLVAGAGSKFALRRRSNRQFICERVTRLLIPFIVGSILLTPFQRYLEALHKGTFQGSFLSFIPELLARSVSGNLLTPGVFATWGLHLWFLAFLFAFSLLALPVYRWLERDVGGRSFRGWAIWRGAGRHPPVYHSSGAVAGPRPTILSPQCTRVVGFRLLFPVFRIGFHPLFR